MSHAVKRFRIGLSFSGCLRSLVREIAFELSENLSKDTVLFDEFHEAEFARADLAFYLPSLYSEQCDLIVAVLDPTYIEKDWTGLEWNAIFSKQKSKDYQSVMLLSAGRDRPEGLFGLEGTLDIKGRTPKDVAALILERLALNEDRPRDHYRSALRSANTRANQPLEPAAAKVPRMDSLWDQFYLIRRERDGKARRKALLALADRLDRGWETSIVQAEFRIIVWKQLVLEARFHNEFGTAASRLQQVCDEALGVAVSADDRWLITYSVAEADIDLSQAAPATFETNKLAARLNTAIKQIGSMMGLSPEDRHTPNRLSEMLACRARCRRNLANLMRRRVQYSREIASKIKALRNGALNDATKATEADSKPLPLMEKALALFAISSSHTSETAIEAVEILESLIINPSDVLACYEYVRQLKHRHRFGEAIRWFYSLSDNEQDRRRFNANLTLFVTSIVGLYYDGDEPDLLASASTDAINWSQDAISTGHQRARDVVDYCYLLAIRGSPVDEFVAPLAEIDDGGSIDWNLLKQRADEASSGIGSLDKALLLGLEDAMVWSRIGTLYADFSGRADVALFFYDQAVHLDPRSPVYHFNKARVLAYRKHEYEVARSSLAQARHLKKNMWGWFKVNKNEFQDLEAFINANET